MVIHTLIFFYQYWSNSIFIHLIKRLTLLLIYKTHKKGSKRKTTYLHIQKSKRGFQTQHTISQPQAQTHTLSPMKIKY